MKKCLVLLALMCATSFAAYSYPASSPVANNGQLSVDGRKILNKNSQEYVLRGMSMYWNRTDWPGGKFYKQSTVTELAGANWRSNVVRAAIGNGSVQDAKNFMDWTAQAGIYVIVDWHVHDMNLNNARNFFNQVAQHAKDNEYIHVIYEVFNEPINQTWASIKSDSEQLIDAIRTYDKNGLILVGTPYYSSDVGAARTNPITSSHATNGPRSKNVMYVFHFYSSDPDHDGYMLRLRNAYCADFPVFVSEFGTSKADGGRDKAQMDQTRTNKWMSLVESLGLSWANWSMSDTDESSAALTGNCCGNGTWNNSSNLSASGKYIQNIMKNRNNGSTIAVAGLTEEKIECSGGSGGSTAAERDGIVRFGVQTSALNYESITGLKDSVPMNSGAWALTNDASTFKADYSLADIPRQGTYLIRFRYGTTASNATVSWNGPGLEDGSVTLTTSNAIATWRNETALINITTNASATPLHLNFDAKGTNNFALVNLLVSSIRNCADSVSYGIVESEDDCGTTNIVARPNLKQNLFDISGRNLILHAGGNVEIYSLHGRRAAAFNAMESGKTVSLQGLPSGAYLAVLRNSGQIHTKTIYLK